MHHVKSLDGIRGLAIALVVLFHFGFFPAGWVGVQVFFVLSGYLITSILLRENAQQLPDFLGRFYWRRALRIFPLYFVFLAVILAIYAAVGEPRSFANDWPYVATYTTNFGRLRSTDIGPAFVHLWSLAVEEQFYLFWPVLVYFLPLPIFKRVVIAIVILAPLTRLGLYFAFQGHDADWIGRNIYCLPFTQFDAFAVGASISLWRLQDTRKAGRLLCVVLAAAAACGMAVLAEQHLVHRAAIKWSLGYSMYLLPDGGFVWGYSLINLLSMAFIVSSLQRLQALRILENTVLVRIGTISYGIYVYHLPILLLMRYLPLPRPIMFIVYCAITLAISEISFRYLETPFLKQKERWVTTKIRNLA